MGSLFPVFAALAVKDVSAVRSLSRDAFLFLVFVATPIVGVVIIFARDLLTLWISANFAYESAAIAKWLTVGVYINVLAQVPYTALISSGRARQVARIQIFEMVCYVLLASYLIWNYSAMGAATAWTIRSVLDALLLTAAARWTFGRSSGRLTWWMTYQLGIPLIFIAACYFVDSHLRDQFEIKCLVALALIGLFVMWEHVVLKEYKEHVRVRSWFAQLLSLRQAS
jgi:O-antigen/teichoic acid export membrane protein